MTDTQPAIETPAFLTQATRPLSCRTRPDLFHTPENQRESADVKAKRTAAAVDLCLDCPLMLACRDAGRKGREYGVWGAETEEERAAAGYPPELRIVTEPVTAECGTEAAARRHRRRGELVDERCMEAERVAHAERERRRQTKLTCAPHPQELKVLTALAEGLSKPQIERRYAVSRRSVNSALWRLRRLFNVATNEQLIDAARASGTLPPALTQQGDLETAA